MPMVYPLVKNFVEATVHSTRSKGTGNDSANAYGSKGYRLESRRRRSGSHHAAKHPLSLPGETRWGSEENIVKDTDAKTTGTSSSSVEDLGLPMHKPTAGGAQLREAPKKDRHGRNASRDVNQIIVTQEFTVVQERSPPFAPGPRSGF